MTFSLTRHTKDRWMAMWVDVEAQTIKVRFWRYEELND